jgi:hypothetical protein
MEKRQIILRLPEEVLQKIDEKATREDRSRNNYIVMLIKQAVEGVCSNNE